MATIKEKTLTDANDSTPPVPPIPPDPPDVYYNPSNSVTTIGKDKNTDLSLNPQKIVNKLKYLHVTDIPLECNYDLLSTSFGIFGQLKEIRMNLDENGLKWEAWLTFDKHEACFSACRDINKVLIFDNHVKGSMAERIPKNLEIYRPSEWISATPSRISPVNRTPKPPVWLVVTTKEDKFNYYRLSRHLQKLVGGIKSGDISRFGKGKVLIHTKSKNQSLMLLNMSVTNDAMIKDIKPHLSFSYGRGVIFDRDLYEFDESEILEMSPQSVCKVKKIPNTNMIILTFEDAEVPSHVIYENERVKVRPFHPKPLQCYNCYQYGHPSNACRNARICSNCSSPEHGTCVLATKCINCHQNHKSNDKNCDKYKLEVAALAKANLEHTTIGYAKRLLDKSPSYARVLRNPSINTTRGPTPAPVIGDDAGPVVLAHQAEPVTSPVMVRKSPIRVAVLPTEREGPPRVVPSTPCHSPIRVASQAESLPDLMGQEQSLVTKRVRTPSSSPPHVRHKYNSPERKRNENQQGVKVTKVEVHPSAVNKNNVKSKIKNKPLISRNANEECHK